MLLITCKFLEYRRREKGAFCLGCIRSYN